MYISGGRYQDCIDAQLPIDTNSGIEIMVTITLQ